MKERDGGESYGIRVVSSTISLSVLFFFFFFFAYNFYFGTTLMAIVVHVRAHDKPCRVEANALWDHWWWRRQLLGHSIWRKTPENPSGSGKGKRFWYLSIPCSVKGTYLFWFYFREFKKVKHNEFFFFFICLREKKKKKPHLSLFVSSVSCFFCWVTHF